MIKLLLYIYCVLLYTFRLLDKFVVDNIYISLDIINFWIIFIKFQILSTFTTN